MKKFLIPIVFVFAMITFIGVAQATVYIGDGEIIAIPDPTPAQSTPKPTEKPKSTSTPSVATSEKTGEPAQVEAAVEITVQEPEPTSIPTPEPTPTPTPTPSLEPVEPFEADYTEEDETASIVMDFALDASLGVSMIEIKGSNDYREILMLDDEGTGRISVPVDDVESLSFVFAGQTDLIPKDVVEATDSYEYQPKGQYEYENQQTSGESGIKIPAQGIFIIAVIAGLVFFLIYSRSKKRKAATNADGSMSSDGKGSVDMEEENSYKDKKEGKSRRATKQEEPDRRKTKRFRFGKTDSENTEVGQITKLLSDVKSKCTSMSIGICEDDGRQEFYYEIENDNGFPDALHCVLNMNHPEETEIERRLSCFSDFLDMVQSSKVALTRSELLEKEATIPGLSHSMTDEYGEIQYVFWF